MSDPAIIPSDYISRESLRLSPHRDYRILRGAAETAYLDIHAPPQGQILATVATRVDHFSELTDTLPSLGLPSRMKSCLVYYACWQLLSQRLPINQEALTLTSRQTESGTEERTEVLDGAQSQTQTDNKTETRDETQTDDKTQVLTGLQTDDKAQNTTETVTDNKTQAETIARDVEVTETRAGSTSEVTDLEQTENKDETLTTTGGETTTDVRTAATTGTTTENMAETTVGHDRDDSLTVETVTPSLTTTESGTEKIGTGLKTSLKELQSNEQIDVNTTTSPQSTEMTWDEGTPARQTGQNEKNTITVHELTTHPGQGKNKEWMTEDPAPNAQTTTFGKVVTQAGGQRTATTVDDDKETSLNHESNTNSDKTESTSEDSQGTVTKDQSDRTLGTTGTVSAQEKTVTDDGTTTTVTDEDTTDTTLNTGTQATVGEVTNTGTTETSETTTNSGTSETEGTTVNTGTTVIAGTTDNSTVTSTGSDKVTGMETMNTYRDRLQTAQYYKMLFDLEVQAKKMRSWVARGL